MANEEIIHQIRTGLNHKQLYEMFIEHKNTHPEYISVDDVVDIQFGERNIPKEIKELLSKASDFIEEYGKLPPAMLESSKGSMNLKIVRFDIRDCPEFDNNEVAVQIIYHQHKVILRNSKSTFIADLKVYRNEYERRIAKMKERLIKIYSEDTEQFGAI